jgi:thiol reductant ABC exporter CydD subunit
MGVRAWAVDNVGPVTTPLAWAVRRATGQIDEALGGDAAGVRSLVALAVVSGLGQSASVVVQAVLLATVIDRALQHGATTASLVPELVGLGIAVAARGAFGWIGEWASTRTAALVAGSARRRLLGHLVELGPSWLAGERAGELALSATRGVDAMGVYIGRYLPQLVLAALAPLGVLAWVGAIDWISLLILLALVALVPPAMVFFGRRAAEATSRQWRRLASLSAHLLELVQGLPTLRAFGRVAYGRREVAEATEGLRRSTLQTLRVAFLSSLALELLAGLGTGLVAMVLGLRLLDGHTSLYVALAVLLVSPEVFLPLRRASAEFHAAAEGRDAGQRIAAALEVPGVGTASRRGVTPPTGAHPLRLDAARVEFAGRDQPALAPLTLTASPGQHVALIGPSGSGKSTALHAVLGLVPLSSGRILVGQADLATVDLNAWRTQVAWVPQRPHLFSGTIRDNLLLADPGASPSSFATAAEIAGLDSVLTRLPHGLDTAVGEGGAGLSSGERQRVAIARAVLHGGRLVLLDEVGSHLDPDARRELAERMAPWLEGRTVVIAAHHPDLVGDLHDVVVLGAPTEAAAAGEP